MQLQFSIKNVLNSLAVTNREKRYYLVLGDIYDGFSSFDMFCGNNIASAGGLYFYCCLWECCISLQQPVVKVFDFLLLLVLLVSLIHFYYVAPSDIIYKVKKAYTFRVYNQLGIGLFFNNNKDSKAHNSCEKLVSNTKNILYCFY